MTNFNLAINLIEGNTIDEDKITKVYTIDSTNSYIWVSSETQENEYIDEGFNIPDGIKAFDIVVNLINHIRSNGVLTGSKHDIVMTTNHYDGTASLNSVKISLYYTGELPDYNPLHVCENEIPYLDLFTQGFAQFKMSDNGRDVIVGKFNNPDELRLGYTSVLFNDVLNFEQDILNRV